MSNSHEKGVRIMEKNNIDYGLKSNDFSTKHGPNGKFFAPIDPPEEGSIPISTRTELDEIRKNLSGKYHLTADIDLSTSEWNPIGEEKNPFHGTFDGQGFEIRNLMIANYDKAYGGLFAATSEKSLIKNVGLAGTNINSNTDVGGICARSGGDIYNCYNVGIVIGSAISSKAGGICGILFNGIISHCYNIGEVSAPSQTNMFGSRAGGICGHNNIGNVNNCFNLGKVFASGTESCAGGICGSSNEYPITNCCNTGNVSVEGVLTRAGGICGQNGIIDICYNTGEVSASGEEAAAGGIVGDAITKVTNSYNTGKVFVSKKWSTAGGICGINTCEEVNAIDKCFNIGEVKASGDRSGAGGICGYSQGPKYTIGACYCLDLYVSVDGILITPEEMKVAFVKAGFDIG